MPDPQHVALPVYLDHAASTAVRPEVLDAMLPFFSGDYANPSAHHAHGRAAHAALEDARGDLAEVLGAVPEEIVFTSGGTESINAAIKGVALAQMEAGVGRHVVTTEIEHHAVLHSAQYLERFGFEVELLPVDEFGRVTPEQVAAAVREDTVLVSIGYANNEVGTVQPLPAISAAVRERAARLGRRIPLHTDAVQVANSHRLDVNALGVDLLSLSGHKFGGPKGTGLLYLGRDVPFLEQVSGGGQERQRRSGTENVPGIVGIARAAPRAVGARGLRHAHQRAPRPAAARHRHRVPHGAPQRPPDRAAPAQPARLLPGDRGRVPGRRAGRGRRRVLGGSGVHLGDVGALARAARDGRAAGARDRLAADDALAEPHRAADRLRGGADPARAGPDPRNVARHAIARHTVRSGAEAPRTVLRLLRVNCLSADTDRFT